MQKHVICRLILVAALIAGGCKDRRDTPSGTATPGSEPKAAVSRMKDPSDLSQTPDLQLTAAEYFAEGNRTRKPPGRSSVGR